MTDLDQKIAEVKAMLLNQSNGDLRLASFLLFCCANEFETERALHVSIKEMQLRQNPQ